MKYTKFFALVLLCTTFSFTALSAQCLPGGIFGGSGKHTLNFEADAASLGASYNHRFNRVFNPGVGVRFGMAYYMSLYDNSFAWQRTGTSYFIYNRFTFAKWMEVDLGYRWDDVELIVSNDIGSEIHTTYKGAYINPMFGLSWLKVGPTISFGNHHSRATVINPIMVRLSLRI